MIRTVLFCFSVLFIFQKGKAQEPLVAYAATSVKDGVLISFTMRGGFSCNGINIERSEDSVSFSVIGDIEGICGNPDFDVPFSFVDPQPLPNRNNFYRLDMKQLGYSSVLSVFFIKSDADGILIFPNPCRERCSLYFENTRREKVKVELFQNGKMVFTQFTNQDFIELDMRSFASGIYICQLQYPYGTLRKQKFALVRP